MTEPSRPPGAVFLSYAREDAEAARCIAEALRGFGIEVWFDLSELRGGDAWDQQIRRQIRECTLFIPVISAHTQARDEGYFRREWRLAVDRTHDMADSRAFIVPVMVDATREADANVPEQFLKAHFSRLPGGEPTPQFVEQVKRLLQPVRAAARVAPVAPAPGRRGFSFLTFTLGAAVLGLIAFVVFRPAAKPEPVPSPVTSAPKPAEPMPPSEAPAKSIAVLPFVDMSQAKDQEYFSDGLSEELLNLLAKVPALKVTSRSSAFSYKGKEVKLSQVAKELGVAHILEGSVRKSGDRLRITAQLIDARSDNHLWSETYDRPLGDIFAVQDEIAAAVVAQLKIALLGAAPKAKTFDPKAYALHLQARQLARLSTPESLAQSLALSQQALTIDPTLANALVLMSAVYSAQADFGYRTNEEGYRLARAALDQALVIDPNLGIAHAALARVVTAIDLKPAPAAQHLERALALEPTNTEIVTEAARFARTLGRYDQTIIMGEYVVAHDPVNTLALVTLGGAYIRAGRYEEGIESVRTALRLSPDRGLAHYVIGLALLRKNDPTGALAEMQREPNETWRLDGLALAQYAAGRPADSDAAIDQMIRKHERDMAWNIACAYAFRRDADRAFAWLEKAILYRDPGLTLSAMAWQFDGIRDDPRWLPFLRRIGYAPEQLAAIKFDVKLPDR